MNELLILVRETIVRACKIAAFQSHAVEGLPETKWFAIWSAVISFAFVVMEQMARGSDTISMILVPSAWILLVLVTSQTDRKVHYRIASALLLGMIPVCAVMILAAGHDLLEWAVAVWGAAIVLYVLIKQHKEWSL